MGRQPLQIDIRLLGWPSWHEWLWRKALDLSIEWEEIDEILEAEIFRISAIMEHPDTDAAKFQLGVVALDRIQDIRNQAITLRVAAITLAADRQALGLAKGWPEIQRVGELYRDHWHEYRNQQEFIDNCLRDHNLDMSIGDFRRKLSAYRNVTRETVGPGKGRRKRKRS